MNLMYRAKMDVGINPAYDIPHDTLGEVDRAKAIFLAAAVEYTKCGRKGEGDIVEYALSEVWHAAKQYYAQHPEELNKCIVL